MARKYKDISGLKIGTLTAISRIDKKWLWQCDCGQYKTLKIQHAKSCKGCGSKCKITIASKDLSGKKFNKLTVISKSNKVTKRGEPCEDCICDCGKLVTVNRYELKSGHTKSCGCLSVEKSKARLGPLNPNYKHGSYNDKTLYGRGSLDDKRWTRSIYRKDNYTCQICGYKNKTKIEAHHLNSYIKYPEQRHQLENGTVLCTKCHIDFHKKYGKITTKEMFEDYKNKKG